MLKVLNSVNNIIMHEISDCVSVVHMLCMCCACAVYVCVVGDVWGVPRRYLVCA